MYGYGSPVYGFKYRGMTVELDRCLYGVFIGGMQRWFGSLAGVKGEIDKWLGLELEAVAQARFTRHAP